MELESEQNEQSEIISGNIHTEIITTKDNGFQCKKWFITYHIKEGESFEQAFNSCKNVGSISDKWIFAEEYGKQGNTPHIQGAFILKGKDKKRATTLAKYWKNGITLRKLKNWEGAFNYCLKEGNNIITSEKIPKKVKILKENQLFKWQTDIVKILKEEPDDRTIYWYYDENKCGTGKTTFCKYLVKNMGAIVLGGKSADMKNGIIQYCNNNNKCTPEIILINLPRTFDTNYLSYTGIEECKDMMFYSGKYEGGMVCGNCPHLIIFSNELPDDVEGIDSSRWKIFNIVKEQWINPQTINWIDE